MPAPTYVKSQAWLYAPVTPILYVAETGLASSLAPISVRVPVSRSKAENARVKHLTFSYGIYVHTIVHKGAHTRHTHTHTHKQKKNKIKYKIKYKIKC